MTHLEFLKAICRDMELTGVRPSPAESLNFWLKDSNNGDGDWSDIFNVGDHVLSSNDLRWKIVGFTIGNTVIVTPAGLDHNPAVRYVEFMPEGLRHEPTDEVTIIRHSNGLVAMEWEE